MKSTQEIQQEEQWHRINDSKYSISNLGNLRNDVLNVVYDPIKYRQDNGHGYLKVRVPSKNGLVILGYVHRLVASYFIPNPENKPCIDHINGIKSDNRACNLRWCTYKENMNNPVTKYRLGSTRGKHRVYDNPEHTKYHYEN